MRCRLGVGEGTVDKAQSLVDATEHPQRDGIKRFRCGARLVCARDRIVVEKSRAGGSAIGSSRLRTKTSATLAYKAYWSW